eukprot:TRINITY_DN561_c0_g1_i1.p1 TRINITY_DN561_c0_g1~~TRINITY_DN561_c0_g1_i1.p1  ORF type:complete len:686 (-),score=206.43 TRINITY_DN561_c0_g1_i1:59-2116(-)
MTLNFFDDYLENLDDNLDIDDYCTSVYEVLKSFDATKVGISTEDQEAPQLIDSTIVLSSRNPIRDAKLLRGPGRKVVTESVIYGLSFSTDCPFDEGNEAEEKMVEVELYDSTKVQDVRREGPVIDVTLNIKPAPDIPVDVIDSTKTPKLSSRDIEILNEISVINQTLDLPIPDLPPSEEEVLKDQSENEIFIPNLNERDNEIAFLNQPLFIPNLHQRDNTQPENLFSIIPNLNQTHIEMQTTHQPENLFSIIPNLNQTDNKSNPTQYFVPIPNLMQRDKVPTQTEQMLFLPSPSPSYKEILLSNQTELSHTNLHLINQPKNLLPLPKLIQRDKIPNQTENMLSFPNLYQSDINHQILIPESTVCVPNLHTRDKEALNPKETTNVFSIIPNQRISQNQRQKENQEEPKANELVSIIQDENPKIIDLSNEPLTNSSHEPYEPHADLVPLTNTQLNEKIFNQTQFERYHDHNDFLNAQVVVPPTLENMNLKRTIENSTRQDNAKRLKLLHQQQLHNIGITSSSSLYWTLSLDSNKKLWITLGGRRRICLEKTRYPSKNIIIILYFASLIKAGVYSLDGIIYEIKDEEILKRLYLIFRYADGKKPVADDTLWEKFRKKLKFYKRDVSGKLILKENLYEWKTKNLFSPEKLELFFDLLCHDEMKENGTISPKIWNGDRNFLSNLHKSYFQ